MNSNKIKILLILILIVVLLTGCKINTENKISEKKNKSENLLTDKQKYSLKFELLSELAKNELKDNTLNRIYQLIENAKLEDLEHIYSIIDQYCFQKYKSLIDENENCQEIVAALKKRGDILKDEEFKSIKNDDENLARRLYELQALLMTQRKATGGDKYFSKENVEKVNVETKKLMKERFEKILEEGTYEELYQELVWIMANTPATCGTRHETNKSPKEFGLYGSEICGFKQKIINRARQKLANELSEKDLCGLTDDEKQELIEKIHNCKMLIDEEGICKKISNKDVVGMYNKLVDKYCSDKEKVDCEKEETTETQTETEEENQTNSESEIGQESGITNNEITEYVTTEIKFYNQEHIGWDFEILSENLVRDDVYVCILDCGYELPLEIVSEEELICYDRMANTEVPCEPRPMIPEESKLCTEECLMQFD